MTRLSKSFKTIVLCTGLCTAAVNTWAIELVTPQEMMASMSALEPLAAKAAALTPGAPQIEVVQPRLNLPIASPTSIQLLFVPSTASAVKPETFKVFYGRLRIDITQRMLNSTKVTAEGINVKEASLPKGSHRLMLSIEDSQGRQGLKTLDFEIN